MTLPTGPVPGTTKLYRRIPPSWLTLDEDLGCQRISSAAFRDKAASIFIDDALAAIQKQPHDILAGMHAWDYLVSVTAAEAVALDQEVERSPRDDVADDDVYRAHGEIIGSKEKKIDHVKVKHRLCRLSRWIVAPTDACPDAEGGTGHPV